MGGSNDRELGGGTVRGDRAHIILTNGYNTPDKTSIFLYTHWEGYRLHEILGAALKRGESRWDDPAYLSRIIASELFRESDINGTTGAGLGTTMMEGSSNNDLVVDLDNRTVTTTDEKTYSYAEFIAWPGN